MPLHNESDETLPEMTSGRFTRYIKAIKEGRFPTRPGEVSFIKSGLDYCSSQQRRILRDIIKKYLPEKYSYIFEEWGDDE